MHIHNKMWSSPLFKKSVPTVCKRIDYKGFYFLELGKGDFQVRIIFIFQLGFCCCIIHRLPSSSRYFRTHLPFSTTTVEIPSTKTHFMVDYLSEKCGLSTEQANNASKALIKIKSPKNSDSVLKFLKQSGFDDTHIKKLICKYPRCLSFKVDKTLNPKLIFFQELGFSGADFAELATRNPRLLLVCVDKHFRPSVDFLRNILGTDDRIARAIRRSSWLLSCNYVKVIVPSLEALRRCGFRDHHISYVVLQRASLLFRGPSWIEKLAARAEGTGFRRGSPMLVHAILAMGNLSRTNFEKKLKLFKSFGWTEEEILSAFRRAPNFLSASERKIRAVMGFLMDEIGYKPSEIASRPMLFMFSFEKRLVPRYEVLKILKSRDLLRFEVQLWSAVTMTEGLFLKTYVMKYLNKAPDLREAYIGRVGSELSSAARALLCN